MSVEILVELFVELLTNDMGKKNLFTSSGLPYFVQSSEVVSSHHCLYHALAERVIRIIDV
jgi:hypothetical protein